VYLRHLIRVRRTALFACCLCLWGQPFCRAQSATNLWKFQLPLREFFRPATSSAAIASDGTIYQATFQGVLFALTPQGTRKWQFQAGREIKSSPAIADDGTIYFGSRDRRFYAVSPEGRLKWTFRTGAWVDSSPAVGADGTIYFGSWDKTFYALKPDGTEKWAFATSNIVVSSPAIGADGTIYFGSHDKRFYALNPDGTVRWTFLTGGEIISSPALAADGTVYFTSTDGNLYALRPDGTVRWHLHTNGAGESSPVLDSGGNIYLMVNNCLFLFTSDGKSTRLWCGATVIGPTPALAADGTIYFSMPWRRFEALKPDGAELWHIEMGLDLSTSPVIGTNGVVYACDGDGLFAIVPPGNPAPLAKSSWPMFRAGPRHTGRVQAVN